MVQMTMTDFLPTLGLLSHQMEGIRKVAFIGTPANNLTQAATAFASNGPVCAISNFRSTLVTLRHRLEDIDQMVSTFAPALKSLNDVGTSAHVIEKETSPDNSQPGTPSVLANFHAALISHNCDLNLARKPSIASSTFENAVLQYANAQSQYRGFEEDIFSWLRTIESWATERSWSAAMRVSVAKCMLRGSAQAWNVYEGCHRVDCEDCCHAVMDAFGNSIFLDRSHLISGLAPATTNCGNLTQIWDAWDVRVSHSDDYIEDAQYVVWTSEG